MAAAASRTTNVLLLALIVAATGVVVAARAGTTPWSGAYVAALKLGAFIIAIRLLFQLFFGADIGTTEFVTLPSIPMPDWAQGVRLGGTVTIESMVAGFYDGVRLATMIVCIGAANALTGPTRLLRSVPGSLYELGVALVIALSLAPQLVMDARRVREARRLRGRRTRGVRGLVGLAAPVLDGALRRSLDLAAAMDARGYGRAAQQPRRHRIGQQLVLLVGIVGIGIGVYGLLDGSTPEAMGLPALAAGAILALVGLRLAGRRAIRTRYRRDPWRWAETAVVLCSAVTLIGLWRLAAVQPEAAFPSVTPLVWPALPVLAVLAIAIGALPAVLAPPVDDGAAPPTPAESLRAEQVTSEPVAVAS
jgi:energy-coupling factor transport system permease protein